MILIDRHKCTDNSTTGKLFFDGKFIAYTLEDVVLRYGTKIYGKTAIPRGVYSGRVTRSTRFKRNMVLIYNDDYAIIRGGVKFDGIRIHGGNTHVDTSGCILAAYNRLSDGLIQGTAEKEITEMCLRKYGTDEFAVVITESFI